MAFEFEAVVDPASDLKNILEVFLGLHDEDAKMNVSRHRITITLENSRTIPISVCLLREWFETYKLNTQDGEDRTISFSAPSLCHIVIVHAQDGDTLTLKCNFNQDSSVEHPLFFDFNNPNSGNRRFSMNVRGSERSSDTLYHERGLQADIKPRWLLPVLFLCHRNREVFSLTLSSNEVRVAVDQRFSYALNKGPTLEYVLQNQEEDDGRTSVITIHPDEMNPFLRAVIISNFPIIFAAKSPRALVPQLWPPITVVISPDLAWFTFFPSSFTSLG